jgi:hypothetical protein
MVSSNRIGAAALMAALVAVGAGTAQALTVNVDPVSGTAVALNASAGETFDVSATGLVNLSGFDGPYTVDPNGMIVDAPPVGSGSYTYFAGQVGGPPAVGGTEYTSCCSPVDGAAYGAMIGQWTGGAWFVIGSGATLTSPANGDNLLLWVNDTNYVDNLGGFTASISSGVPEPATWAMLILGFGVLGLAARRRRLSTVAA